MQIDDALKADAAETPAREKKENSCGFSNPKVAE